MTITKAVERIQWRMKNGWKPNANDIEAINGIIDFVNQKHQRQINDYQLFAKLYIFVYSEFLSNYKTTVFDNVAQVELHRLLEKPIEHHIEDFRKTLNDSGLYQRMESNGFKMKHPALKTQEERDVEVLPDLKDEWEIDEVRDNLTTQINLAINQYA